MPNQVNLTDAQRSLVEPDTTCVRCGKTYVTSQQIFTQELPDGIKQVTLDCPHCHLSVHVFYTNQGFEQRAQRLKFLFARYQKSRIYNHLLEARTAQQAYQKDFARFNQRQVDKRHPLTKERYFQEATKP